MSKDRTIDGTIRLNANHVVAARTIVRRDILSQVEGPGSPQQIMLIGNRNIIGRSPSSDIQMRSNMVSRRHLSLVRVGGELYCKDLNSHNGLLLNGIKIHKATLKDGDTIQIGDIVFVFYKGVQWTSS